MIEQIIEGRYIHSKRLLQKLDELFPKEEFFVRVSEHWRRLIQVEMRE
jgi:hypothetical protein